MGAKFSNLVSSVSSDKNISTNETSEFDFKMNLIDFSIPDDLLIDILSYVSAGDLIRNCRLVCKEWKSIVDGHSVWKLKCQREKKNIPSIKLENIPNNYYEKIYLYNPYGRNLIQNPCGEAGLDKWIVVQSERNGFAIENPPAGADPVPQEVGSQSCFATTYFACMKHQVINLYSHGICEEVLQLRTTKIEIGEWFAARFDCASDYNLYIALLDENYESSASMIHSLVDDFTFDYREEQWIGKEWHSVTHTFENVGKVRYVYFRHYGKDCQFWAGHYGSKMTGAFVKVIT